MDVVVGRDKGVVETSKGRGGNDVVDLNGLGRTDKGSGRSNGKGKGEDSKGFHGALMLLEIYGAFLRWAFAGESEISKGSQLWNELL